MKNLTVAVCTDVRGGMMFNNRRQSRDRALISELVGSTDGRIYISAYSRLLFEEYIDRVVICDDPVFECEQNGFCFVEDTQIIPHLEYISRFIIYNWNKKYPFDRSLGFEVEKAGFIKESELEFSGSSHKKITKGVYIKK